MLAPTWHIPLYQSAISMQSLCSLYAVSMQSLGSQHHSTTDASCTNLASARSTRRQKKQQCQSQKLFPLSSEGIQADALVIWAIWVCDVCGSHVFLRDWHSWGVGHSAFHHRGAASKMQRQRLLTLDARARHIQVTVFNAYSSTSKTKSTVNASDCVATSQGRGPKTHKGYGRVM